MYTTRIDFDVHTFIKDTMPDQFTVTELTKAYFDSSQAHHTELKSARQYIYRQLQELVKRNVLVSTKGKDGRSTLYHFAICESDQDHSVVAKFTMPLHSAVEQNQTIQPNEESTIQSQLIEKIKLNKLELLTSMGETEAFLEWADTQPQLTDEVKSLYKASKDKTSKLLGKVSGYEKLLALYQLR